MKSIRKTLFISLLICLTQFAVAESSEWTKWRGPEGNGSSPETNWKASEISLENIKWTCNVGKGHSAVVVKDNRLYTLGNYCLKDSTYQDVVVCLNTESGKEIWKFAYPCFEYEDPGPFSSPLLDNGKLYTISRKSDLYCFNAENGSVIWNINLEEKGYVVKDDNFASSPQVFENLIILNQNHHGIAFDKNTGKLAWNSSLEKSAMSTPVFVSIGNEKLMLAQNEKNTVLVDPKTGKMFWEVDCYSIADPLILKNSFLVPYWKGFRKYELTTNKPKLLWENTSPKSSYQSFVTFNGHIFGFGNNRFQCISLEDGSVKWSKAMKTGAVIIANNILIIISQEGKLVMAEANPVEFKEIKSI